MSTEAGTSQSNKRSVDHVTDAQPCPKRGKVASDVRAVVSFANAVAVNSFLRRCATIATDVVLTFFASTNDVPECAAQAASTVAGDDEEDGAAGCMFANVPDTTMSCMVVSKLACDVSLQDGEDRCVVCVPLTHLRTCLASIGADLRVEFKVMTSGDMCVCASENVPEGHVGTSTYRRTATFRTLVADCIEYNLHDMMYQFTLVMRKQDVAGLAKCASKLGADTIRFDLRTAPDREASGETGAGWKMLSIHFQGDMAQTTDSFMMYQSSDTSEAIVVETDDALDQAPLRAPPASDSDVWKNEYSDSFSAATLSKFVGAMDNDSITLRLSPDKPLVMTAPLGEPSSWTCFVLASRDEDDEA